MGGGGGNEKGEMGREQQEGETGNGAKGRGRRRGKRRVNFTMDIMKCLGGHMECLGGMRL